MRLVPAVLVALALAPAAHAGTLALAHDTLSFTAARGEANDVQVVRNEMACGALSPPCALVTDTNAITAIPMECAYQLDAPNRVVCPLVDAVEATLGDGNDSFSTDVFAATVEGGDGNDILSGGTADDTLGGGAGDDWVSGGGGDDTLYGDDGRDTLDGGRGSDTLDGGLGIDRLSGGAGTDELFAQDSAVDTVGCGPGRDVAHVDYEETLLPGPAERCESLDRGPKIECYVPDVVGQQLEDARWKLEVEFCAVGRIAHVYARARRGTVLAQRPPGGKHLPAGSRVALVVSLGR